MRLTTFLSIFFMAIINVHAQNLVEISSYRDNFAAGETVQFDLKFSGELDNDLQFSNLKLSNANGINVDSSFTIEKINDFWYYVYFNLPINLINDTYKFSIRNLDIYDGEDLVRINKDIYFTVTKSNYSLSIYPGIFLLNNDISSITVKNNLNINLNVKLFGKGVLLEYDDLDLNAGNSKNVQFRKDGTVNYSEVKVSYGDKFYLVPVYFNFEDFVFQNQTIDNITISKKSATFLESGKIINKSLFVNESISAPIKFYNNGDVDLSDVQIEVSDSLSTVLRINQSLFGSLKKMESKSFLVEINGNLRARQGQFQGTIKLKSGQLFDIIYVYLDFKKLPEIRISDKNVTKVNNITNNTRIIEPIKQTNLKKIVVVIIIILVIIGFLVYIAMKKKTTPKARGKNYSYYLRR